MSNREGDIDQIIAEALKGGVERLPPESGNVDWRIKVKGDWVGGNKTVNVSPHKPVPDGNPNGRECPQCAEVTWLATKECIACGYDLFEHDAKARRKRVDRRKIRFIVGLGAVAVAGGCIGSFVPDGMRLWVYGFSMLSAIMAMELTKD